MTAPLRQRQRQHWSEFAICPGGCHNGLKERERMSRMRTEQSRNGAGLRYVLCKAHNVSSPNALPSDPRDNGSKAESPRRIGASSAGGPRRVITSHGASSACQTRPGTCRNRRARSAPFRKLRLIEIHPGNGLHIGLIELESKIFKFSIRCACCDDLGMATRPLLVMPPQAHLSVALAVLFADARKKFDW